MHIITVVIPIAISMLYFTPLLVYANTVTVTVTISR